MKVTKKARLLAKPVPLFADPDIGLKIMSVEPVGGSVLKVGETWRMKGEGLQIADETKCGFAPSDQFFMIGEDIHGMVNIEPSADGRTATVTLNGNIDELPPGSYEMTMSSTTYKAGYYVSSFGEYKLNVVKEA